MMECLLGREGGSCLGFLGLGFCLFVTSTVTFCQRPIT